MAGTGIDPDRLYQVLATTGLQNKDQQLYQLLFNLIGLVRKALTLTSSSSSGGSTTNVVENNIYQILGDGESSGSDDGLVVPGPAGQDGTTGAQGPMGVPGFGFDGEDGESYPIAAVGPQGNTGATGAQGATGVSVLVEDGLPGEDAFPIPNPPIVVLQQIGITVDGSGAVLTTGVKGYKSFPSAGTIVGVRLLADTTGSIVMDIWKDTYANYPPTNADSITSATPPTISASNKSEDNTLSGWTTTVNAGDVFGFNIDSVSTITRIVLEITIAVRP